MWGQPGKTKPSGPPGLYSVGSVLNNGRYRVNKRLNSKSTNPFGAANKALPVTVVRNARTACPAPFLILLLCAVAEGATAVVYAAEDLLTGRPVALKVCSDALYTARLRV